MIWATVAQAICHPQLNVLLTDTRAMTLTLGSNDRHSMGGRKRGGARKNKIKRDRGLGPWTAYQHTIRAQFCKRFHYSSASQLPTGFDKQEATAVD